MKKSVIPIETIQSRIFTLRGQNVMIDRDLSELYGVQTKRLNEQVKRNIGKFPKKFMFQLTKKEKNELVANCDRLKTLKHSTVNPYVFTEHGVLQVASVLNSETANRMSIYIVEAFIKMRHILTNISIITEHQEKFQLLLKYIERYEKALTKLDKHDKKIKDLTQTVNFIIKQMLPEKDEIVIKGFRPKRDQKSKKKK